MPTEHDPAAVREAVAVFHEAENLEAAVDQLQSCGFDRADISLLASEHAVEKKLSHRYCRAEQMADDAAVPRTAFVSTAAIGDAEGGLIGGLAYVGATVAVGAVVVSGGTLAAIIAAAVTAGGAGGLLGSVLARQVGEHHARYLHEQVAHGGMLLWVRTWNAADEFRAAAILRRHAGDDVHFHHPDSMGLKTEIQTGEVLAG